MTFGLKRSTRHNLMGVKHALHGASAFGAKAISVGELFAPEYFLELEAGKQVLNEISELTK